jgi:hypothetical protein
VYAIVVLGADIVGDRVGVCGLKIDAIVVLGADIVGDEVQT